MIRKIVQTDDSGELVLDLPKNLQGRQVEVIAFAVGEEPAEKRPALDFYGKLSRKTGEDLRAFVDKSRNEWPNPFENR